MTTVPGPSRAGVRRWRPSPGAGPCRRGERGAVTAELALGLVSVVLVLGGLLAVVAGSAAQLRCLEAARTAARVAALGEGDDVVATAARTVAGPGAAVAVRRDAPWVTVTVTTRPGAGWVALPAPSGTATAWVEP